MSNYVFLFSVLFFFSSMVHMISRCMPCKVLRDEWDGQTSWKNHSGRFCDHMVSSLAEQQQILS